MSQAITGVQRRSLSLSASDIKELVWLASIGGAITIAHALLKSNLGIPGHHVEWMAMLVIARRASKYPWAATFSSVFAGGFALIPGLAGGFGTAWITYIAAGMVMDLLYTRKIFSSSLTGVAVMAALAHLSKPLLRIPLEMVAGVPYKPLLVGAIYPILTYLVFGFTGGAIGYGIVSVARKYKSGTSK